MAGRAFWGWWGAGLLAAVGLSLAASAIPVFPGDEALADGLQGVDHPVWEGLMVLGNGLGAFPWLVLLWIGAVVALLVARRPWEAFWLSLAAPGLLVSGLVKELVGRPRPSPELVRVQAAPLAPSFPSGHVFADMLLFGFLFLLAGTAVGSPPLRLLLRGLCLLVLALAGLARVYVGAHWPSDVLGGYLLGGLVLALLFWGNRHIRRRPGLAGREP